MFLNRTTIQCLCLTVVISCLLTSGCHSYKSDPVSNPDIHATQVADQPDTLAEVDMDKIDLPVRKRMDEQKEVRVILLGSTQLLKDAKSFDAFCKKNNHRKRKELRKDVMGQLKSIAAQEQKETLTALGNPENAASLWILNAISVKLSNEQIRKASTLKTVKYIYFGNDKTSAEIDAGTVAEVIRPATRKPFSTEGKTIPWNLKQIGAEDVWNVYHNHGEDVIVGVFEGGVNYTHEDLRNNVWTNENETPNNGIDDDHNGYIDDYYGYNFTQLKAGVIASGKKQHGTWTSGIVAGDGNGGTVTGVAPRSRFMILSSGGSTHGNALAIQYALENGADIISMSFSIPGLKNARGFWRAMSEHAVCAGLVLVSGAGNFGLSAKKPVQLRIPEGIPCVIAAGGVNKDLQAYTWLSKGPVEWSSVKFYEDYPLPKGLVKPDVSGFPGPFYPVLHTSGKGYIDPNNKIKGNSFSSPHVAGVAALMMSAAPDIPSWSVKTILMDTARDLYQPGKDNITGAGLANALRAVSVAKAMQFTFELKPVGNSLRPCISMLQQGDFSKAYHAATAHQNSKPAKQIIQFIEGIYESNERYLLTKFDSSFAFDPIAIIDKIDDLTQQFRGYPVADTLANKIVSWKGSSQYLVVEKELKRFQEIMSMVRTESYFLTKEKADDAIQQLQTLSERVNTIVETTAKAGIQNIESSFLRPGFMGIRSDRNHKGSGILIMSVNPDTPAAKAGLQQHDIILKIDGADITDWNEFQRVMQKTQPLQTIKLNVERDGQTLQHEIELKLGTHASQ